MNNDILLSTKFKSIGEDATVSMPSQIKALFGMNPQIDVRLIDYDYIGDAKDDDYTSFAEKLYKANPNAHYILVTHSNELKDSLLVRKTFHFDLTGFYFSEEIQTWSVPISNNTIVFLGVIEIETFEDLKTAIRFLFSGIYDSQNFLIQHGSTFAKSEIVNLLERALLPIKNRYGENQDVIISMASVCQHKKDIMVLYPYGGTISEVLCYLLCSLDIICITALLFSTTLCNYPVLSFQEYGKRTNIHCKHASFRVGKSIA